MAHLNYLRIEIRLSFRNQKNMILKLYFPAIAVKNRKSFGMAQKDMKSGNAKRADQVSDEYLNDILKHLDSFF